MILNSLKRANKYIDITPHTNKDLKQGAVSDILVSDMDNFVVDLIQNISTCEKKSVALSKINSSRNNFKALQERIKQEIPDKLGNMRFIPAEYIEALYIITYYASNKFDITQKDIASMLGCDKKIFRERGGISPVVDKESKNTRYTSKIIFDEDVEYLEEIIPLIGTISANISNIYLASLSNNFSIITNLQSSTGKANKKGFNSRQHYFNINKLEDMYQWVFIKTILTQLNSVKTRIVSLVDSKNQEMNEEIFKHSLEWGINICEDNLRRPELEKFKYTKEKFDTYIKERDWFITAKDTDEYDFADVFLSDTSTSRKNKEEVCNTEITRLDKKIKISLEYLIDIVDFSSLEVMNEPLIKYLLSEYEKELYIKPQDNIFDDNISFSAKYFIYTYFNKYGVDEKSYNQFKDYMNSSSLREYLTSYIGSYGEVFQSGKDTGGNTIIDKFNIMEEYLLSKSDNRNANRFAIVYINLNDFSFSEEELRGFISRYTKFCFIIVSYKRLNLDLEEELITTQIRNYYIYNNAKGFL